MFDLSISIVIYNTPKNSLLRLLHSIKKIHKLKVRVFLLDNSGSKHYIDLKNDFKKKEIYICYIANSYNLGFGKAHNIALKKSLEDNTKYHLVLNPDIYFDKGVLEELYDFMENNPDVGLIMPKVLYPNGRLQYLCKLLPTPFDLFGRRFLNWGPFKRYVEKRNEIYELRFTGYDKIMEVPYLSGCFMFLRTSVLKQVGLFDERFFLYLEDTDLSRRIHRIAKTIYYPYVHIYHEHCKGSYKNFKLLRIHIESAVKYFNKWGWFIDSERDKINKETLKKLGYQD